MAMVLSRKRNGNIQNCYIMTIDYPGVNKQKDVEHPCAEVMTGPGRYLLGTDLVGLRSFLKLRLDCHDCFTRINVLLHEFIWFYMVFVCIYMSMVNLAKTWLKVGDSA